MKSPESKSSTPAALQHTTESNPFFSKARSGVFDPDNHSKEPFFSGIHPVQAKLKIHPADDAYEKEADAVADQVVKQVNAPPPIQRKEPEEENIQALPLSNGISSLQTQRAFESPTVLEQSSGQTDDNLGLQTKAGEAVSSHSGGLESQLQASSGGGSQLPESTRSRMESGFGSDFSGVRVHTGSDAVQMNRDVGARAFTHGNDIYFNSGEYTPNSTGGDHLLAHELTHIVQQGASKSGGVQRKQMATLVANHIPTQVPEPLQQQKTPGKEPGSIQLQSSGAMPTVPGNGQNGNLQINNSIKRFSGLGLDNSIQRKIGPIVGKKFNNPQGEIDTTLKEIKIKKIPIPSPKDGFLNNSGLLDSGEMVLRQKTRKEDPTNQAKIWNDNIKGQFDKKLKEKLNEGDELKKSGTQQMSRYVLKLRNADVYVIGTETEIESQVRVPKWNKGGNVENYEIDHKAERQLGGKDAFNNIWLLQATANGSFGSLIEGNIKDKVNNLLKEASDPAKQPVFGKQPTFEDVKKEYKVIFKKAEAQNKKVAGDPTKVYESDDIIKGQSLTGLKALETKDIKKLGLDSNDILNIFSQEGGGKNFQIKDWDPKVGKKKVDIPAGANLQITEIAYKNEDKTGDIKFKIVGNKSKKIIKGEQPVSAKLKALSSIPNAVYIGTQEFTDDLSKKLEAISFSPIKFKEISLEPNKGLVARGQILPSIKIIENAAIDLVFDGDNIYLEKVFNTGEFKVPAPFKISDSSLAIRAGTNGIEFEGGVDFGIDRVGEGSIKAHVNSKQEFGVMGSFEFDKKLFDNAKVEVSYENRQWAVKGTIEIPKGKVKGIKKASATIAYSEGTLSASGTVEPEIKGVKQGSFELKYSQDQFMMSGQLQLSPEIPRLKKGEINVTLESKPDSGYKLKGSGIAEFDFPGINTGLNVQYDDGLLTVEATVNFEKGIAKGEVKAGATNKPVDGQGNPVGEPGDKWTIYGGGTLTVKITPWLQVTAGVHFLPNGELEVLGRIELPSTVDVFSQKSFEKTLFSMPTIEIPLFAIPLGPKSLGLVAQIRGGLDFKASIGPGQLRGLFGQIKYNPSRPEETTLSGGGSFVIPAEAGLNLHASLGLGLSVGIASLTGGIELVAGVGLKGEASAGLNLSWNPTTGLELNAEGRIMVQPKFKFNVNLFARASLDLFLFEISKEWRYNLASFEWGPGFEFGLVFPIHYKEGQPFNISFDDIQVIKPDVDILGTAKGLANKVKDEVF